MIDSIRISLQNYFLKKENRRLIRNKKVYSLSTASSIGIIHFYKNKDEFVIIEALINRLKNAGKNVKMLVYIENNELIKQFYQIITIDYITRKDLNFYFKAIGSSAIDFIHEEFDILIDLNFEQMPHLKYFSVASKASFKVGSFTNDSLNPLDMMIKLDSDQSIERLIKEIEVYLKMIQ